MHHISLTLNRNLLPLIEKPFDEEDRRAMISDFLFPDTAAPSRIFQRIRAHASIVTSLASWERGDTMRNLQTVSIDHHLFLSNPECLTELAHIALVAGVCKSKELLGDKPRVRNLILPSLPS